MEITKEKYLKALKVVQAYREHHRFNPVPSELNSIAGEEISFETCSKLMRIAMYLPRYENWDWQAGDKTLKDFIDMGMTRAFLESRPSFNEEMIKEIEFALKKYEIVLPVS